MTLFRTTSIAALLAASLLPLPAFAVDGTPGGDDLGDNGLVPVIANGGDATEGGTGGAGGHIVIVTTGPTTGVSATANGGAGGDTAGTDNPGTGGAGGTIVISLDTNTLGDVDAIALGGRPGSDSVDTGVVGTGGAGGNIIIAVNTSVVGHVLGAAYSGGSGGAGGHVLIGISAPVLGSVAGVVFDGTDHSTGGVEVDLRDGAEVGGTITASSQLVASKLSFQMKVDTKADYAQARQVLKAAIPGASGTVTINGHTYSWQGFQTVEDLLTFIGKVMSENPAPARSNYLHCLPGGKVIAYRTGPDSETFNAKNPTGGAFFHVGNVSGSTFTSTNPLGWTVSVATVHHKTTAQVLDGSGAVVATCSL